MNLQKRRLERGWSQEQLAEAAGLSVRTVQRIERGETASLETLKCLAAVFETNITDLMEEFGMTRTTETNTSTDFIATRERDAVEYVQNLKGLYVHLFIFAIILPGLAIFNHVISPGVYWVVYVAIPWALAIGLQALITFGVFNLFGAKWERRQFQKRMKD